MSRTQHVDAVMKCALAGRIGDVEAALWAAFEAVATEERERCAQFDAEVKRLAELAAANFAAAVDAQERIESVAAAERERCALECEAMTGGPNHYSRRIRALT